MKKLPDEVCSYAKAIPWTIARQPTLPREDRRSFYAQLRLLLWGLFDDPDRKPLRVA